MVKILIFIKQREGAQFVGDIDVSELKNMKKQIMIYKFNYMINCLPKYTTALTGYIENKNFIEELSKYIFQTPEEKACTVGIQWLEKMKTVEIIII